MMWKDSYRLGVDQIDTQHRELFRMTAELVRASKGTATEEDCQKALGFLKDYVIRHFRDEEAYQASIQYSDIEAHKAEHREFTKTVLAYEKRLQEDGFDQKIMQDLAGTVTVWLIYHVVDTDQRIVAGKETFGQKQAFDRSIDLFCNSALDVMETMGGLDRSSAKQQAVGFAPPQGDVFVTIDLIGDQPGAAIFGFSKDLALHLLETMTMIELEELDALVQSALCELTNIICGNVATALTQHNIACDIKPPVLSWELPGGAAGTSTRIDTPFGWLDVSVRFDEID